MKKFTRKNLESCIDRINKKLLAAGLEARYSIGYKALKEKWNSPILYDPNAKVHMVNGGTIKELVIYAWGIEAALETIEQGKKIKRFRKACSKEAARIRKFGI